MNRKSKAQKMTRMALLIALTFILQNLPFRIGAVEMTLGIIPVEIGAMLLGPAYGAALGAFMGLASFLQCYGFFVPSPFGAALVSMNVFYTLVICIVSRVLMGYLCGLIFKLLKRIDFTKTVSYAVAATSGAVLNTVFFTSLVIAFFYNTPYIQDLTHFFKAENVFAFAVAFVGINGIVEAVVSFFVGGASAKILSKVVKN